MLNKNYVLCILELETIPDWWLQHLTLRYITLRQEFLIGCHEPVFGIIWLFNDWTSCISICTYLLYLKDELFVRLRLGIKFKMWITPILIHLFNKTKTSSTDLFLSRLTIWRFKIWCDITSEYRPSMLFNVTRYPIRYLFIKYRFYTIIALFWTDIIYLIIQLYLSRSLSYKQHRTISVA